mmetsp:Transcript_22938/g.34203  ORF Transcript_22938/g.34203 Transcript_22938/m.34203 type:complete len:195 (-) Transcript_22938:36-620(-)
MATVPKGTYTGDKKWQHIEMKDDQYKYICGIYDALKIENISVADCQDMLWEQTNKDDTWRVFVSSTVHPQFMHAPLNEMRKFVDIILLYRKMNVSESFEMELLEPFSAVMSMNVGDIVDDISTYKEEFFDKAKTVTDAIYRNEKHVYRKYILQRTFTELRDEKAKLALKRDMRTISMLHSRTAKAASWAPARCH